MASNKAFPSKPLLKMPLLKSIPKSPKLQKAANTNPHQSQNSLPTIPKPIPSHYLRTFLQNAPHPIPINPAKKKPRPEVWESGARLVFILFFLGANLKEPLACHGVGLTIFFLGSLPKHYSFLPWAMWHDSLSSLVWALCLVVLLLPTAQHGKLLIS